MTPLEETIQKLMEPDKHGEKGEPVRSAAGADYFGHPVQRTLDALWKFAEGTAAASADSMDWYNQAIARIAELEKKIPPSGYIVITTQEWDHLQNVKDSYRAALVKIHGIGFYTAMVSYREGLDRARMIAAEALLNPPKG